MPRAIWTGALTFGLVTVPVRLYPGVQPQDGALPPARRENRRRASQQRRVDPAPARRSPTSTSSRATRSARPATSSSSPRSSTRSIQRRRARSRSRTSSTLEEIDPIFYDHPYYLAPGAGGAKPYRLLLEAMPETGVAIAKVVIRRRSTSWRCGPRATARMATMHVRRRGRRPRRVDELAPSRDRGHKRELDIAKQLIDSLAGEFEPEQYKDTYREEVLSLIERKAEGEEIEVQPEAEEAAAPVPDLMSALKASLDAVRDERHEEAPTRRPRRRAKARRPRRRGAGEARARQGRRRSSAAAAGSPAGCTPPELPNPPPPRRLRRPRNPPRPARARLPLPRRGRASASTDAEVLARIGELVIPPAWQEVWICPYPGGHIQATGIDQRGPQAVPLPPALARAPRRGEVRRHGRVRPRAARAAQAGRGRDLARDDLSAEHVLAVAVRLLDRGFFRIGSEDYAVQNETYGLATMKKRHVRLRGDGCSSTTPRSPASAACRRSSTPRSPTSSAASSAAAAAATSCWPTSRPPLARRQLLRHQRLPQGRDRRRTSRPRTSGPGARPCWPRSRWPSPARRGRHQDGPQARDHARRQGGRRLPRQHAGGRPRLLHRPARLRPLPRRRHDRRALAASARPRTAPRSRARSRRRCSSSASS